MQYLYLLRYSEIFLKSDYVRRRWERKLLENIKKLGIDFKSRIERGRIWIFTDERVDEKLKRVFGIVSFSLCQHCSLSELEDFVIRFCRDKLKSVKKFAVRVKRVGKHEFTSQDMERRLGALILKNFPDLKVDLKNPDKIIYVEIRDENCYVFDEILKGVGGIPLGVEGRVVSLISGVDSSVATWMMMKRGCEVIPIHFDIRPFANLEIEGFLDVLRLYNPDIDIILVDHGSFLKEMKEFLKRKRLENYICVLCKRRMLRIAEEIAKEKDAKGIVTGDSLGQVASQTLDNMMVISQVCSLPIYRPLIGMDKVEIEEIAKRIGFKMLKGDVCKAVPKKPTTKAKLEKVLEIEEELALGAR